MRTGTPFRIDVNPRIPARLARLTDLANNLWYSWDRPTRALFARLHPALWDAVGHSPKAMLKRIDEQRLTSAAADPGVPGRVQPRAGGVRRLPRRAAVPRRTPARFRANDADRVFLRRVRLAREPADLLRRPRHPRRATTARRRATSRCRSSPSGCSTARATSCRPSTARASSAPSTAIPISTTCRSCPRCRRTASELAVDIELPRRATCAQGLAGAASAT